MSKTTLRPDFVLVSVTYKKVFMLEFTVTREEQKEKACKRKQGKVVEDCLRRMAHTVYAC